MSYERHRGAMCAWCGFYIPYGTLFRMCDGECFHEFCAAERDRTFQRPVEKPQRPPKGWRLFGRRR